MQVFLIVVSVLSAVAFFLLGCVRLDTVDERSKLIEDPKLRVESHKSISVLLCFFIVIAALTALLYFSISFGKLKNYESGFTLRPAKEWEISEQNVSGMEKTFTYTRGKDEQEGSLIIRVFTLNKTEAKNTALRIKETERRREQELRDARKQLKAAAKEIDKQLKLSYDANIKQLKQTLKNDKKGLKSALEENRVQYQRSLGNNRQKLEEDLEKNEQAMNTISISGFLRAGEENTEFTAIKQDRLYTLTLASLDDAVLKQVNIAPFGFFYGIIDGFTILIQGPGSLVIDSWHPFKRIHNTLSYLAGFILGLLMFFTFMGWLAYIIVMKVKRVTWQNRWNLMSEEEKHDYRQQLWEEKLEAVNSNYEFELKYCNNKLESVAEAFNEARDSFQAEPEQVLAIFNAPVQKGAIGKAGSWVANVFTGGKAGFDDAKDHYDGLYRVYEYYQDRCAVSEQRANLANTQYNYVREKAVLYAAQLKEITKKLSVKQRELLDKSGSLGLASHSMGIQEIQNILQSIDRFNADYDIQASESLKNTMEFAGSVFTESLEYVSKGVEKRNQNKDDGKLDLALGAVGAGIGLVSLAAEGIGQYLGSFEKNREGIKRLKEAEVKLLKTIDAVESNRTKLDSFTARLQELNDSINKSIEAYIHLYKEVSVVLYPKGDSSKSRDARQARQAHGDLYFTQEEAKEISKLGSVAQIMLKIVDAEL